EIKDNMKVTLLNDPVNMARSLLMMEEFGWITFDETIDPNLASEKDIVENYYELDIVPLEAAQIPRTLDDADFAFINGNLALSSGLTLAESIQLEHTPDHYLNYVVVRKEDASSDLADVVKNAYKSETF